MKRVLNIVARVRRAIWQKILLSLDTCQQMAPVMSDSMERRLGPVNWIKLRIHLFVCLWCRRYLQQIKMLRRVARKARVKQVPPTAPGLSSDARSRITAALSEAGDREG